MTSEDEIERIWARQTEDKEMTREEIAQALRPRVARRTRQLWWNLWIYLGALGVTLVLQVLNLVGYRDNAQMFAIQAVLTALALGLFAFGLRLAGRLGRIERMDADLAVAVSERLAFLRGQYEAWLWACAGALLLLTWAINTLVDNANGTYRINKPIVFVMVELIVFPGMYVALKAAHEGLVRELRAVSEDLEAQMLERTQDVARFGARLQLWRWIAIAGLTLLFLLGIWMAVRGMD